MDRSGKFFRSLHWKLTLSYTLVTVSALLVVQLLAAVLVWGIVANSNIYPRALIALLEGEIIPQIAVYLDSPEPDIQGLSGWLQAAETSAGLTFQSLNFPVAQVSLSDFDEDTILLVADPALNILAGLPSVAVEDAEVVFKNAEGAVKAALAGENDLERITQVISGQSITIALPVVNETQDILGVVVLKTLFPPRGILVGMFSYIGGSLIFFTIAAGIVGTLFGFITARSMTRRLRNFTRATDSWSQGDFSTFIQEPSRDELGQLARRLNQMAEQLQNLMNSRQELAAMEERTRLARDLHDSVKQQVFATAMQVGAARALIDQDAGTARKHLDEAEALSRQAQIELTSIIRELRPATLVKRGLVAALKQEVEAWSRLNRVTAEINVPDECVLPEEVESTLFRIAQEALSNIARHSQADQVEVHLECNPEEVRLMVKDDGRGFDLKSVHGKGSGLNNMGERIEVLGGDFQVESAPGKGTRLVARCLLNRGGGLVC